MPVVSVRIRTGPKKQQYAMIVHLAMTLSTSSGWVLLSEDKAYDLPLPQLSPHDSAIPGEVDGGRARRQLASGCSGSRSASAPAQPFFPVYPRVLTAI